MHKGKVLIIDDETDFCLLMKSYFMRKNYKVFIAETLKAGLELLEALMPDILLLDNNLPDGFGWSHTGGIIKNNPAIKIYLISAYKPSAEEYQGMANVSIWEKPLSKNKLDEVF
ncbi:MAG: response regulator [Chitinophagaceae bacterium]|nr:response regulator [Chitinophagaceae bacterium]